MCVGVSDVGNRKGERGSKQENTQEVDERQWVRRATTTKEVVHWFPKDTLQSTTVSGQAMKKRPTGHTIWPEKEIYGRHTYVLFVS